MSISRSPIHCVYTGGMAWDSSSRLIQSMPMAVRAWATVKLSRRPFVRVGPSRPTEQVQEPRPHRSPTHTHALRTASVRVEPLTVGPCSDQSPCANSSR